MENELRIESGNLKRLNRMATFDTISSHHAQHQSIKLRNKCEKEIAKQTNLCLFLFSFLSFLFIFPAVVVDDVESAMRVD